MNYRISILIIFFFSQINYLYADGKINQNTINWIIDRDHIQKPRGGQTAGVPTEKDTRPSEYFISLQSNTQDKKEKDRLAILSMIGEYRANFEFTEMFGAKSNYALDVPYKTWGTEVVLPITNQDNFISLQHILVMYIQSENGTIQGPHVQKHWRQDWKYEDDEILTFLGKKEWINKSIVNVKGTWSQSVYQVDDSPRYESFGQWVHEAGVSRWMSKVTPRPLPRREFSVRDDYNLISAINKISIMEWGWVMEELNDKIKTPNNYVGSEYGVVRYQKIKNYNFQPAYDYWDETKDYWQIVRDKWTEKLTKENKVCLEKTYNGGPLYMYKFNYAEEYASKQNIIKSKKDISEIINKFIKDC